MGRIRQLPDDVINRIAAGEVVERPASVLKELLENALDTDTPLIEVELDGGGRDRILVRDAGHGMDKGDLVHALDRHATSKLDAESDLLHIATLGFRGEALPSIAAVSDLRLRSRARGAGSGWEVRVQAGTIRDVVAAGMPEGTEVIVQHLFRHQPARRKFLRSADTEKGHCLHIFSELALSAPERQFRLRSDGKELYNLAPTDDRAVRAQPFFPGIPPRDWLRLSYEQDGLAVRGLIAPPVHHHASWAGLHLFINGRAVQDKVARYAVREAFRLQLPPGRFPRGIVQLTSPYDRVDVNVHPQKFEVRFREPQAVREVIAAALHGVLRAGAAPASAAVRPALHLTSPPVQTALPLTAAAPAVRPPDRAPAAVPAVACPAAAAAPAAAVRADYRLVGSVRHSYLIVEREDGLHLIDQHAAHERWLFDRLMRETSSASQGLLVPYTLELNRAELALAQPWFARLAELGFVIEPFGGTTVLISGIPAALGKRAGDRRLLVQVVEDLLRERDGTGRIADVRDYLIKTIACKAAIKAGEPLQAEEMYALCDMVFGDPPVWTCPHGRPICWKTGWDELARRFAR